MIPPTTTTATTISNGVKNPAPSFTIDQCPFTIEQCPECLAFRGAGLLWCLGGSDLVRSNKWRRGQKLPSLYHTSNTTSQNTQRKNAPAGSPEKSATCCKPVGTGTEMKSLLAELDVPAGWCEGCTLRAKTMDENGVEWCRKNRAKIIGWLQEAENTFATAAARIERDDGKEPTAAQIQRAKIAQRWKTGWAAATKMIWINPLDPFGSLVDEAVRRAEAKPATECSSEAS